MGSHTHTARLKARREVAERTLAFHFDKPEGFTFKPGQAIDLNLVVAGAEGSARTQLHTLSLVSAPHQDEIVVATRMRDTTYKLALRQLAVGSSITFEGPAGLLTLSARNQKPAVLIAGGIGVAPFVSMLAQAAYEWSPRRLSLLYSNRRPEDAAFLEDLRALEQRNPNFRLIATMTRAGESGRGWDGETGLVDERKIRKASAGFVDPLFYLAGPPDMVESVYEVLENMGIDSGDIRVEEFHGY
jgi:ferredoxin-NADP reductase